MKDSAHRGAFLSVDEELALLPLGLSGPDERLGAAIDLALRKPAATVTFLRRHRVVGLGLRRLAEGAELPAELRALRQRRADLDALLQSALRDVQAGSEETGVPVAGIKGLAMRALYPLATDRDTGDVDVMCNSVDEAWELASWLRRRSYDWCQYEWPWLKRDRESGEIYGQFQVWQEFGEISKRIDIHFAGYSVRHSRRAPIRVSEAGFSLLTPSDNLPCLLGNAAGDFLVRLKDVNDTQRLLELGIGTDPATLAQLSALQLRSFWSTLMSWAEDARAMWRRPRWWVDDSRAPFGVPDSRRRTIATLIDAYRDGADRGGLLGGVRTAIPAWDYYRRDLRVQVQACTHTRSARLIENMTNETCIRLIPPRMLDAAVAGAGPAAFGRSLQAALTAIPGSQALRECRYGPHSFVSAGDEVFVPTLLYQLCRFEAGVGRLDQPNRTDACAT